MKALYPSQEAELAFLSRTPRALLLSETGTGKTPPLLCYAQATLKAGGSALWVTKKGLQVQLQREADVWLQPDVPRPVPWDKAGPEDRFRLTTHGVLASRGGGLEGWTPQLLIVDEGHKVGGGGVDPNAATYKAILDLSGRAERSVFATATPVGTAHGLDLLALLECAHIPGTPSRAEVMQHVRYRVTRTPWGGSANVIDGITSQGLAMLMAPLSAHAVRSTVHGMAEGMPALRRSFVDVPLVGEDAWAYAAAWSAGGLRGHRYRETASRSAGSLIPALLKVLSEGEAQGHRHVVVFTERYDLFEPIEAALRASGRDVQTINGDDTPAQRTAALAAHAEASSSVLLGTGAVETGLNIQHASLLVSVVQSWNPAREEQREGRLVRLGSPHTEVRHVVIRPGVALETRKVGKHDRKREVAEWVLAAVPKPAVALEAQNV